MKPKKILMLAIVSGLLTTGLFYIFMQRLSPAEATQPVTVEVVAAAADIEENAQLTEENLQLIEMQESEVHPAAVKDKTTAVGEYTSASLAEGEVLLSHRIQKAEQADIISKKVADGYRAVSISVDFVKSVSNLIEPEDHVDVVLTPFAENGEETPEPAEILMEDVKVLAVGQRMTEKKEGEAATEYIAVTLELTQEDAVSIVDASARGSIQLMLSSRLKGDEEATEEEKAEETETTEEAGQKTEDVSADEPSADVIVLPENALVRNGPSLTANVITVVNAGDSLIAKGEEQKDADGRIWMHVETKSGKQGWISSRIIKLDNE